MIRNFIIGILFVFFGRSIGLGFFGVLLGAVLTAPVAVMLLSFTSWKVMFFILGAIGIVWAIIW